MMREFSPSLNPIYKITGEIFFSQFSRIFWGKNLYKRNHRINAFLSLTSDCLKPAHQSSKRYSKTRKCSQVPKGWSAANGGTKIAGFFGRASLKEIAFLRD